MIDDYLMILKLLSLLRVSSGKNKSIYIQVNILRH